MDALRKAIQIYYKLYAADRIFIKEIWDGGTEWLTKFYAVLVFELGETCLHKHLGQRFFAAIGRLACTCTYHRLFYWR